MKNQNVHLKKVYSKFKVKFQKCVLMDGLWRQRIIMENWKVSLNFLPIIIHDGNVGYKEKNVKSLKDVL